MMNRRVVGLLEGAAVDPENIPPPREIWFDDERLKEWFADRKQMQSEIWRNERDG